MPCIYDAIIAGAGPAGLHAARCCEKSGLSVLVLEEHAAIGMPNHCSGLVSKNIETLVPVKKCLVKHKVRGAVLHAAGGGRLALEKPGIAAYVIDRPGFDQYLASKVKSEIMLGSRADSFAVEKGCVKVNSGKKTFRCSALLGCDGPNSRIRKALGVGPKEMLNGIIATVAGSRESNESEFVEIWYDKRLTDGFLWMIPRGDSTEYGMLGGNARFSLLEGFFKARLKGRQERRGGLIALGPPKTYFERALLAGDAAAQVKPWSGGGVIFSMTAAEAAAKALKEAKGENDFSENTLKRYEQGWKRAFGMQIEAGMLARAFYRRMGNAQISLALSAMGRASHLMNKLDMDFVVK